MESFPCAGPAVVIMLQLGLPTINTRVGRWKGKFFGNEQPAMIFRHENYNLSGGGTRETFISVSKYKSSGSRYFHKKIMFFVVETRL